MHLIAAFVLGCAIVAGTYQLFQLYAARRFFRRNRATDVRSVPLPPVSVMKPLKGAGDELYENLAAFCRQDYPHYQIVFGVTDASDPAVGVVQRLRREFPERDIVLSVADLPGPNRKIANLRHMLRQARHDVLVMSDADIRVRPDYLRAIVTPLAGSTGESPIGLTTCLYRGAGGRGLGARVEMLFINTDFIQMVLTAQMVQRFRYAFGASIAVRREALERIGGFAALADYLADDYVLGNRVAAAGYRLVLLPHVVDTMLDSQTLGDVWRRQLRWARTYRVCQPVGWFGTVITQATLWGVLSVAVTGGSALGWGILASLLGIRLAALAAIMPLLGADARQLWLVPAKDLLASAVWLGAFLGRRVNWGGRVLAVLHDGRLVPVTASAELLEEDPPRLEAAGS